MEIKEGDTHKMMINIRDVESKVIASVEYTFKEDWQDGVLTGIIADEPSILYDEHGELIHSQEFCRAARAAHEARQKLKSLVWGFVLILTTAFATYFLAK